MRPTIIALDFDGTLVVHEYPDIGSPAPGATAWCKKLADAGATFILWTCRSGDKLRVAVDWCEDNDIPIMYANKNPEQYSWTESPKVYADLYIDDRAFGVPKLSDDSTVDWETLGPKVLEWLNNRNRSLSYMR